jgi:hypothetical protein
MDTLVIEGDPRLLANFDAQLRDELAAEGVGDQVTIQSQLVAAEVAPGEFGFGEEIRRLLIGVAKILEAGEKSIMILARGIASRLARDSIAIRVDRNGVVHVTGNTKGDIAAMTAQLAEVLRAMRGSDKP